MHSHDRIYVAGHRGLVGQALVRALTRAGFTNLLTVSRTDLDLTDQKQTREFLARERPTYMFVAAARVGGIQANRTHPADFIRDNLQIQTNLIDAAYRTGVTKLLFLGSSCIYPKLATQPITEAALLTGPLEPTNEWYAIAKIAGIKMVEAYRDQFGMNGISLMPTNLYGPGDNFDLQNSHVLPALLRKFHEARLAGAKEVVVWGSGTPRREFLHVDDLAEAALFLMQSYNERAFVNVGTGTDLTIRELATLICDVVGYQGALRFDSSKPDGTPQKLLDVSRLHALGWHARIPLKEGIAATYDWYQREGYSTSM